MRQQGAVSSGICPPGDSSKQAGRGQGFETEHGGDGGTSTQVPRQPTGATAAKQQEDPTPHTQPPPAQKLPWLKLGPLFTDPVVGGACGSGPQDRSLALWPLRPRGKRLSKCRFSGKRSEAPRPVWSTCARTRVHTCHARVQAQLEPSVWLDGVPSPHAGAAGDAEGFLSEPRVCVLRTRQGTPGRTMESVLGRCRQTALGKQNNHNDDI